MDTLLTQDAPACAQPENSYVTCPICPTVFKHAEGWIHHMRVDHWWDLDESDRVTVSPL